MHGEWETGGALKRWQAETFGRGRDLRSKVALDFDLHVEEIDDAPCPPMFL